MGGEGERHREDEKKEKYPKDMQRDHGNNQKQTCSERTWWGTEKSSQSASDGQQPRALGSELPHGNSPKLSSHR